MISRRHHIRARADRVVENLFGNAEAASGVFTVDDHKIQLEIRNQPRQLFIDRRAPRPAHHVTKKK
ncbi:hypothetical protein D3C87_2111330 [compost metagenome]